MPFFDNRAPAPARAVNNSEWTVAGVAVAWLPLMSDRNNRILQIDGDAFFARREIALDPKLEGRPGYGLTHWVHAVVFPDAHQLHIEALE